jgi:hypothetical protein
MKELIAKLENAHGPSRELDCAIAVAVGWFVAHPGQKSEPVDYVDVRQPGQNTWPGYGGDQLVPRLTEFIDDALTLMPKKLPEHSEINISIEGDRSFTSVSIDVRGEHSMADTVAEGSASAPALAICITALKASAAISAATTPDAQGRTG